MLVALEVAVAEQQIQSMHLLQVELVVVLEHLMETLEVLVAVV